MNDLIKITTNDQQEPIVSGRDLHQFLEVDTPYSKWFSRMAEYGFTENIDYTTVDKNVRRADGALMPQMERDHALTLDMAKELAMLQRTEKGKQARQYFIAVEKEFRAGLTAKAINPELELLTVKLDLANAILRIAADPTACALAAEFFGLTTPVQKPQPSTPATPFRPQFSAPDSLPPIAEHRARQKGGRFFAPSGERLYTATDIGKLVGRDCHSVGAVAKKLNLAVMPGMIFWDCMFPRLYFERGRDYLLHYFGKR